VTQAHANIDTSEMMALVTVAESRKTVDSMRALLWRAYKVARAVRKLDARALKGEFTKKELADRYMEMRYAVRPMIYEAKGIYEAVQKRS
jgi:hypothetical protein